eukprot:12009921-Ditylum_brightwellii.AAC.1
MSGTCKAGDVVKKETLAMKGVQGLYISDLSVLSQPADIHPMMTAMSLGIVLGNSTLSVPSGSHETFPVIVSIVCSVVVACLMVWVAMDWTSRRRRSRAARDNLKHTNVLQGTFLTERNTSHGVPFIDDANNAKFLEEQSTGNDNTCLSTFMAWSG